MEADVAIKITKTEIREAIQNTRTMAQAAVLLGVHFSTFKAHAVKHELYMPNMGGKGTNKPKVLGIISLQEILDGKHPSYQTFKLKQRLFKANLKENKCEICHIRSWNDKEISCELDHIDGNRKNHILRNLRILCPNCHSQTPTFRSKKRVQ